MSPRLQLIREARQNRRSLPHRKPRSQVFPLRRGAQKAALERRSLRRCSIRSIFAVIFFLGPPFARPFSVENCLRPLYLCVDSDFVVSRINCSRGSHLCVTLVDVLHVYTCNVIYSFILVYCSLPSILLIIFVLNMLWHF